MNGLVDNAFRIHRPIVETEEVIDPIKLAKVKAIARSHEQEKL